MSKPLNDLFRQWHECLTKNYLSMKAINLGYLLKVQKYCDSRSHQKEFGYDDTNVEWDDSLAGRIGVQLDIISACIEEIWEIYATEESGLDNIVHW